MLENEKKHLQEQIEHLQIENIKLIEQFNTKVVNSEKTILDNHKVHCLLLLTNKDTGI